MGLQGSMPWKPLVESKARRPLVVHVVDLDAVDSFSTFVFILLWSWCWLLLFMPDLGGWCSLCLTPVSGLQAVLLRAQCIWLERNDRSFADGERSFDELRASWRKDIKPRDIEEAINGAVPRNLIVGSVSEVSRSFHPNFSAKWRHYFYILPFNDWEGGEQGSESGQDAENLRCNENTDEQRIGCDECNVGTVEDLINDYKDDHENGKKRRTFSIIRVNQLLQQLEGKLLSYKMFARDTKASRNVGPPTQCFVYHARAAEARLPCSDHGEGRKVMCVELVANRFLRKMVRVLVATSVREAAAGADEDALIKLMDATCRRATAPPAPPDGLCLVDVGYAEFDSRYCLIPKD